MSKEQKQTQDEKFQKLFEELIKDTSKTFQDEYKKTGIQFVPYGAKIVPSFTTGLIDNLPVDLKVQYDELLN